MKKIVFLLIFSLMLMFSACSNYSTGERVGIITKISEKGRIYKTTEGELKIAPTIAVESQMIGQYETFEFSIDRKQKVKCETPIDSIKQYVKEGAPVVLTYQQVKYLNWFGVRGSTDYFVKSVKRAKI